jgi:hypothetical protein
MGALYSSRSRAVDTRRSTCLGANIFPVEQCTYRSPMHMYSNALEPDKSDQGNPPLPLKPTDATPLAAPYDLSTPSSVQPSPPVCRTPGLVLDPNKLLPSRHHCLPTCMASLAKISPKPSMIPLMKGKTRLIPITATIRETDMRDESVKRDKVREGG